jgi:hypothetical protein
MILSLDLDQLALHPHALDFALRRQTKLRDGSA